VPIEVNTASNIPVNLVSRSRIRNRTSPDMLVEVHEQVVGLLRHPCVRFPPFSGHYNIAPRSLDTGLGPYERSCG
jgi:hypothetical protein